MKLQKTLCVLIALALMLSGCTRSGSDAGRSVTEEAEYTEDVFAMDTFMSLRAYGPAAEASVREASEELRRLDSLFSVTNQESEVYAANRSAGTPQMVSEDTMAVLEQALSISGQTGGAMDITIYPVLRTWGFTTGSYQVPDAEAISAMLPYVDDSRIVLDKGKGTVQLPEGAEMDLGALAKGYAGDKLADMLQTAGVSSALLNMGGSTIRTLGRKPDGSKWRIAVQDPEDPEGYAGVIELGAGAVNTSGGYERYFEEAGEIYWHILDPDTGYRATGVTWIDGKAYYFDSKGVMQTKVWKTTHKGKRYFGKNGAMKTGKVTIKGVKYVFDKKTGYLIK